MKTFRCVHCGETLLDKRSGLPTPHLYDHRLREKSNVLKLVQCATCSKLGDEYAEVDGTLILIDCLLQYPGAYRHVIFNESANQIIFCKVAILTVIIDGYITWSNLPIKGEFFEKEYDFYLACFQSLVALLTYVLIAFISLSPRISFKKDSINFLFGLLLAYSFRFGNLFAQLWSLNKDDELSPFSPEEFMWAFINLLFFASSIRIGQVMTNAKSSGVAMSLACVGFYLVLRFDFLSSMFYCL